ncbi:hypothetical protein [Ureibacillus manganicus]|uniref:Uncharacterized protein n=1 Tax=Ureibacillus manganicus DSM 26584 TaxID=1384049 RepID=A0A0A3I712_9BACL|nr:hypothetical protein [Ureibacillus manganicus]KGR78503.1 hypothetical protein CD29_10670 [Ureibacillus manganicus DSM 26584]
MQDIISVERSLLYIQQHHVELFNCTAHEMKEFEYLIKNGGLNENDAWIIAFNIWLLLIPDKNDIIYSAEKTLYYPANFLIMNELVLNYSFKQFKRNHHQKRTIFIVALSIANGINQWIYLVMEKYNLMDLYERNKARRYFDSHLGNPEEIKILAENQARFVKASVKELKTNSFNQMIKNCCDEAINISMQYSHI